MLLTSKLVNCTLYSFLYLSLWLFVFFFLITLINMFTTVLQDLHSEGYNKSCNSPTVKLWLANSLACLQSNSVSEDKDIPSKHLQSALSQRKQD